MMASKQTRKTKQREELAQAHQDFEKDLSRHALFKTNNLATSEDLVQDTFIKTWRYLVRGGKIETMKAFLFHILNNLIVDEYRKKNDGSLDVLRKKGFEPKATSTKALLNELDGKELILLIEQLSGKYKKVLHMKYVQDLSLEEMAILTKQTKNTVAVQVHRGIKKLKRLEKRAEKQNSY